MIDAICKEEGFLYEVQRTLSRAQAFPILGPLIVSPIKASLSIIMIIAGIILGTIVYVASRALNSASLKERAMLILKVGPDLGSCSLLYSVVNILSLGIIGAIAEYMFSYSALP